MNRQTENCAALIRSHFALEDQALSGTTLEELERELSRTINYLLDHDFNRLLNALYKIDISEKTFKEILTGTPAPELGKKLTTEVIRRELQKVATRSKYKNL